MILLTAHITSATAETYLSLSIKTKNNNKNSQIKSASETRQHYCYNTLSQKCNTQHTVSCQL